MIATILNHSSGNYLMSKVGLLIKFTAKSGMRDALMEHFQSLVGVVNAEAGTVDWAVHISPIEPDAVWLYEVYQNQAAMDAHNSTETNAQAKIKTGELTIGRPDVFPLIPIAGKGLG
jgi:quinol monooxygenase YgiN